MSKALEEIRLQDGTLIRHKTAGYEGCIEGTTGIKSCFTVAGASLDMPSSKQLFQYRVMVAGEAMRRIAPAEDLEIVEQALKVVCPSCGYDYNSKPGVENKAAGRCQCGGWICPACLACQASDEPTGKGKAAVCLRQRKRQTKKLAARKKARDG